MDNQLISLLSSFKICNLCILTSLNTFAPCLLSRIFPSHIILPKQLCSSSYLPPSSLVSRHLMRWMSCWEMNSLVMTSSSWLKSALCSSDSTGTAFRYLQSESDRTTALRLDNAATHSVTAKTTFRLSSGTRITVVQ